MRANARAEVRIIRYVHHVGRSFHLRPDIQLSSPSDRAVFAESTNHWSVKDVTMAKPSPQILSCRTGCCRMLRVPDIKGLRNLKGQVYHTGHWPHEPSGLQGRRVGVIGTGSSAIQSVPVIASRRASQGLVQRSEF